MQQSPNPQPDDAGRNAGKNKRVRPFVLEWKYTGFMWCVREPKWVVYGRYRTDAERTDAMVQGQHKHEGRAEFRVPPPADREVRRENR